MSGKKPGLSDPGAEKVLRALRGEAETAPPVAGQQRARRGVQQDRRLASPISRGSERILAHLRGLPDPGPSGQS